eukprot:TRINITY_DN16565_c0_g1_i1.p1 TRINITY_DN16565_c0_g1~~TRINITY_DN16565_c0_g1_i1.p1  ORF type:complete len:106 (-),score=10.03 TRINITY_DN16565_c0_g1_i1:31-348(-)
MKVRFAMEEKQELSETGTSEPSNEKYAHLFFLVSLGVFHTFVVLYHSIYTLEVQWIAVYAVWASPFGLCAFSAGAALAFRFCSLSGKALYAVLQTLLIYFLFVQP